MMQKHLIEQFRYEAWANTKTVEATASLSEIPEKIEAIFSHLLAAQKIWLARLQGEAITLNVWEIFPQVSWQQHLEENTQKIIDYLEVLSDEALVAQIHYQNSKGEPFSNSRQDIFTHLLLHSAYHRGQIVLLLKGLVSTLPVTDYIFYLRDLKVSK